MYHYGGNNPVRYVDLDGRWTFELGFGAGLAGKIKIGCNEGKWELLWRVGFGGSFVLDEK